MPSRYCRAWLFACAGVALAAVTTTSLAAQTDPRVPTAQSQAPQQQETQPAPPRPYKPLAVTLPKPVNDPSLDAFRKEIAAIAARKDRQALASRVLGRGFLWERADGTQADPSGSGFERLSTILELGSRDSFGWQALADIASEPNVVPLPDRPGMVCAPAAPNVDEAQFEQLAEATQTDPIEWAYPTASGVEVRDKAAAGGAVIETLGLHLVRIVEDEGSAPGTGEWVRVVTPSGKLGFVDVDTLRPLSTDQLCYVKEGNAWRIAGYIGGGE